MILKRSFHCSNILAEIRKIKLTTLYKSASIWISKKKTLIDEKIDISITTKKPQDKVTLVADLKEGAAEYVSFAHYVSNDQCQIDLSTQASLGGTYKGVDSMGLFWSMVPAKHVKTGMRLIKKDVMQPYEITLSILSGHQHVDGLIDSNNKMVEKQESIERWYAQDVVRTPVQEGRIRGTLFTSASGKAQPGVIDIFGTAGGVLEFRASLLASRGFTVLALGYFHHQDLTKQLDFDYNYFDEAIQWLKSHPKVQGDGIGVIGVSKGAEIANHMACYNEEIKGCVSIGGLPFYCGGKHTYRGKNITCSKGSYELYDYFMEFKKKEKNKNSSNINMNCTSNNIFNVPKNLLHLLEFTDEGVSFENTGIDRDGGDSIPFEKGTHCEFLIVHGEDDRGVFSINTERIANRFDVHGMSNYRILKYPGAGHLIEPPYTPLSRTSYHKLFGCNVLYGGQPVYHAKAQEHSWHYIQDFFTKNLSSSTSPKF